MFGLFRSANLRVVLEMSFGERAAGSVQQPTMVRVFECVTPYKSDDHSKKPPFPIGRKIESEDYSGKGARQQSDDGIVPFFGASMAERDFPQFGFG